MGANKMEFQFRTNKAAKREAPALTMDTADVAGPAAVDKGVSMAYLMTKYGKTKPYVPHVKREYRKEGFRVRFRLSKGYRNLEKQEILASRPEAEQEMGKRQRKQLAELMKRLEEDMMLPDPDEAAKQKLLDLQKRREQEYKNRQREIKAAKEETKMKTMIQHKKEAAERVNTPSKSQYLQEYWGKPSKTAKKGDWRIKDKSPQGRHNWWNKFTVKKRPKITMKGKEEQKENDKSTQMKVLKTEKSKGGNETNDGGDFFITNLDNSPYSAVEEWQRRNVERKVTQSGRRRKLKAMAKSKINQSKQSKTRVKTIQETTSRVKSPSRATKAASPRNDVQSEEDKRSHSWLNLNIHSDDPVPEIKVEHSTSEPSIKSGKTHSVKSGRTNKDSASNRGNGDTESIKSRYDLQAAMEGLNILSLNKAHIGGSLQNRASSDSSISSSSSESDDSAGSDEEDVLFDESESERIPKRRRKKDREVTLPGQVGMSQSSVKVTFNDNPADVREGAKSRKVTRAHSAPTATRKAAAPSVKDEEQEDLNKPMKTTRYLYSMCECRRVGRQNTLSKLQQRRRKNVGVITIYGCPTTDDVSEDQSVVVCPFCSVFPKKRIEAWMKDVVVVN